MFEMMPMTVEPPKMDRLFFFRQFGGPPAVIDSRRLIVTPSPKEILRDVIELIDEIELDVCNRELAAMYRDVGGEG